MTRHIFNWRLDAAVLIAIALLVTPIFWFTPLDIAAAGYFFAPDASEPWPLAEHPLLRLCYDAAPLVAGTLVLGSLLLVAASYVTNSVRRWRRQAWYVLLVLLVGPGLLVNVVFKEHWDRPRPRQIVEFGGSHAYTPPLAVGEHDAGRAFPSGHASALFAAIALWYLMRRRGGAPARATLAAVLLTGSIVGMARMAAGAHFLSDVIWSAIMTAGVALILFIALGLHRPSPGSG